MAKKVKNKKFTMNELMDETLGKKGTPKRNKFDDKLQKETKRDLKKVIDGKETLIDTDIVTRADLQGYSYDEMLDRAYGKKGTLTRNASEKRIKKIAKNLLSNIEKKEAKEEKEKLTKRLKKIKVNYIHYEGGKRVKVTKGNMFVNQDTFNALKGLKEAKENEALFLKFAKEFSEKASHVSAGDKYPSTYVNNNDGKFRIDYYVKIRDRKTGKIIPTVARINLITGIMEVSKTSFLKCTMPNRIKILLSLYAKWINKNELKENGKSKKSRKSIQSIKVLVKRKPKKGIINKVRKGKKNPIGKKNSKK